jgi:hypothetical protein
MYALSPIIVPTSISFCKPAERSWYVPINVYADFHTRIEVFVLNSSSVTEYGTHPGGGLDTNINRDPSKRIVAAAIQIWESTDDRPLPISITTNHPDIIRRIVHLYITNFASLALLLCAQQQEMIQYKILIRCISRT